LCSLSPDRRWLSSLLRTPLIGVVGTLDVMIIPTKTVCTLVERGYRGDRDRGYYHANGCDIMIPPIHGGFEGRERDRVTKS
jgi:hypothetical protein